MPNAAGNSCRNGAAAAAADGDVRQLSAACSNAHDVGQGSIDSSSSSASSTASSSASSTSSSNGSNAKSSSVRNGASSGANGDGESGESQDQQSNRTTRVTLPMSSNEIDIIRLIGQHLQSLGLEQSANVLAEESGLQLDHPLATTLQENVMKGDLDAAMVDVIDLGPNLLGSNAKVKMHFLLLEQKFLELLARNRTLEALNCLRHQLSPLRHNVSRVHELSSYLMITGSNAELDSFRQNVGETRMKLVERLQMYLPSTIMLPPKRLRKLLLKAQYYQIDRCPLHTSPVDPAQQVGDLRLDVPLLSDHRCTRSNFPCTERQVLSDHSDEVWVCAWSHSGLRLATGSKDSTVILWDLNPNTLKLTIRHELSEHTNGITSISWSADDSLLLVCGTEDSSDVWMWDTLNGELRQKVSYSADDSLTACGWQAPVGGRNATFVVGGNRGQFYLCDQDGNVIDTWEGVRIVCVRCLNDGKTVLAADNHRRIRKYCTVNMQEEHFLTESFAIMSFAVDKAGKQIVLNLINQGLHLWDIPTRSLVRRFRGVVQRQCTIHSCFGGANDNFIASGSEDHKVYIFNRAKETPVEVLSGHTKTVNCVSWNPAYPQILVSASDDGTVRLWGPDTECETAVHANHLAGTSCADNNETNAADAHGDTNGSDNDILDSTGSTRP